MNGQSSEGKLSPSMLLGIQGIARIRACYWVTGSALVWPKWIGHWSANPKVPGSSPGKDTCD